ncbi:MAG: SRPBCC family protein [Chloroflexi bacterium]|nr:SRPBCC family protein [Chloroflexota bacterium]
MAINDYHFITRWRIHGTPKEVVDIITDGDHLAQWWPSVYLNVTETAPGEESGLGKEIELYTKGWLPYTLRWNFRVAEIGTKSFTLAASGDFSGRGIWTFEQSGPWVDVTYDWKIRANKPLLRWMSFLLKPIFAANHHWAMEMGEKSLNLELARRRATTQEERSRIPPPPAPTTTSPLPLLASLAMALGLIYLMARRVAQS